MVFSVTTTQVVTVQKEIAYEVYPNPCRKNLYFVFNEDYSGNLIIELVDLNGRILFSEILYPSEMVKVQMDVQRCSSGMLLYRIIGSEAIFTGKLLKE